MTDKFAGAGRPRKQARAIASIMLAGLGGFMLDFYTTHDRKRVDQAVRLWLRSLDSNLNAHEEDL